MELIEKINKKKLLKNIIILFNINKKIIKDDFLEMDYNHFLEKYVNIVLMNFMLILILSIVILF